MNDQDVKRSRYKLVINKYNSLNKNIDYGWPYVVYLIWLVHPKIDNIGKRIKFLKIKFYFPPTFTFLTRITNWPTLACLCPIRLSNLECEDNTPKSMVFLTFFPSYKKSHKFAHIWIAKRSRSPLQVATMVKDS